MLPSKYGPFDCISKAESIYIGGLKTGGSQNGYLLYPKEASASNKFPFLTFAHGMTVGGTQTYSNYDELWDIVCSWGYIIVGPASCPEAYCQDFFEDVITTIEVIYANGTQRNNIFNYVEWDNGVGVFGHSMGGAASVHTTDWGDKNELNIASAVALHPSCDDDIWDSESKDVKSPILWFTGSADTTVPPGTVYDNYKKDTILPKGFVEIKGANHHEPTHGEPNREDSYTAQWFNCFMKNNNTACDYFFDKESDMNICNGGYTMTKCEIDGKA